MDITEKVQNTFELAEYCYLCTKKQFTQNNYKVNDHCHRTGEYRGATHNMCNINFFSNKYLPVFFHNLKGYDGHLIIREALKNNKKSETVRSAQFLIATRN